MEVGSEVVSVIVDAVAEVVEECVGVEPTVVLFVDIVPVDVDDSVDEYPEVVSAIVDVDPDDAEASVDV